MLETLCHQRTGRTQHRCLLQVQCQSSCQRRCWTPALQSELSDDGASRAEELAVEMTVMFEMYKVNKPEWA